MNFAVVRPQPATRSSAADKSTAQAHAMLHLAGCPACLVGIVEPGEAICDSCLAERDDADVTELLRAGGILP